MVGRVTLWTHEGCRPVLIVLPLEKYPRFEEVGEYCWFEVVRV
jgi:hypothetical protein